MTRWLSIVGQKCAISHDQSVADRFAGRMAFFRGRLLSSGAKLVVALSDRRCLWKLPYTLARLLLTNSRVNDCDVADFPIGE